jgi:hypothetical protein
MNSKYLFTKLAALVLLIAALCVAGPIARQRLTPKEQQSSALPITTPQQIQTVPVDKPVEKPPMISHVAYSQPAMTSQAAQNTPAQNSQPQSDPPPPDVPDPAPDVRTLLPVDGNQLATQLELYPGQELDLTDNDYSRIEISASSAIAFKAGRCQATETVHIKCHNIPSGAIIRLQDVRIGIPQDGGPSNLITIAAFH